MSQVNQYVEVPQETNYKLAPPDGGWGYFVVLAFIVYSVSIVLVTFLSKKIFHYIKLEIEICFYHIKLYIEFISHIRVHTHI